MLIAVLLLSVCEASASLRKTRATVEQYKHMVRELQLGDRFKTLEGKVNEVNTTTREWKDRLIETEKNFADITTSSVLHVADNMKKRTPTIAFVERVISSAQRNSSTST